MWRWGRRWPGAGAYRSALAAAVCAFALAACNENVQLSVAQPRGATVAFESIDGLPAGQFKQLVQNLNDEAQSRRLAVLSREAAAAYRVRGYLSAEEAQGRVTIAWVWDVFDAEQHRAMRISGAETVSGRHADAWQAADDAMLRKIAQASMSELAAFLTSADVAPGTPDAAPTLASFIPSGSPEAAGIFRIFQPSADPVPMPALHSEAAPADGATAVPLPRPRPVPTAVSAKAALTLAAGPL